MLLRFGLKNLRSFSEYQELSFVATKLRDDTQATIAMREHGRFRILPALVVYGANASGKSNLLSALRFMRGFVNTSHTRTAEPRGIDRDYFRLGSGDKAEPTRLDCDFVLNNIRYHYGFDFDSECVLQEWLYSFPDNRRNILFSREKERPIYFGPNFGERSKAKTVEPLMRDNSLFLSVAAQNNLKLASDIAGWFKNCITSPRSSIDNFNLAGFSRYLDDETLRQRIVDFIKAADPTISGMEVVERRVTAETSQFVDEFRAFLRKHIPDTNVKLDAPDDINKQYMLRHLGQNGEVSFPTIRESSGTLKLLQILGPIFRCLDSGGLLVCDELEASLHAMVAAQLMMIFNSTSSNSNGAQILVATHDTNLLDLRCLRRDQIWFAEKSPIGATHIYSLAELSVRKADSIKRGYLQGRFGAIPFLPSAEHLCEPA